MPSGSTPDDKGRPRKQLNKSKGKRFIESNDIESPPTKRVKLDKSRKQKAGRTHKSHKTTDESKDKLEVEQKAGRTHKSRKTTDESKEKLEVEQKAGRTPF